MHGCVVGSAREAFGCVGYGCSALQLKNERDGGHRLGGYQYLPTYEVAAYELSHKLCHTVSNLNDPLYVFAFITYKNPQNLKISTKFKMQLNIKNFIDSVEDICYSYLSTVHIFGYILPSRSSDPM